MAGVARLTPGQLNYWRDRPRRPDFTPGQAAYRREYRAKQNVPLIVTRIAPQATDGAFAP